MQDGELHLMSKCLPSGPHVAVQSGLALSLSLLCTLPTFDRILHLSSWNLPAQVSLPSSFKGWEQEVCRRGGLRVEVAMDLRAPWSVNISELRGLHGAASCKLLDGAPSVITEHS